MPLKVFGHKRNKSNSLPSPSPLSSQASSVTDSPAQSPLIVVNDTQPQSILKSSTSFASGENRGSPSLSVATTEPERETHGHGHGHERRQPSLSLPRSDTTDSRWTLDLNDDDRPSLSPSASAPMSPISPIGSMAPSSLGLREGSISSSNTSVSGMCPLPESTPGNNFPFFSMTLSSVSTLSFIALPTSLRPIVVKAVQRAWKKGIKSMDSVEYQAELMKFHKSKGCDGGVWEVTLKGDCWVPRSEDKVSSKRIVLYLLQAFAKVGYELSTSYRMSAKDSGKDTLIFSRGEPDPDPIFFAIAFYSSDRVWIIDAEADVGEALEDGIKATWVNGVRDARVRQRHCRELRLAGNPWTSHSHAALISARCIHISIMKHVTHRALGYELAGSVSMADLDSNELPVTFYRKTGRGWGCLDELPSPQPISEAAAKSMNIGRNRTE